MSEELVKQIETFVSKNSYFDLDEVEESYFTFTTRENGNVFKETPGELDILEANKLKKLLLENFKNIVVDIETFDEWVNITVLINE
jgi:hypothetical protein